MSEAAFCFGTLAPTLDPQRILKESTQALLGIGQDHLAPTLDPQRILKGGKSNPAARGAKPGLHPRSIRRGY